MKKDNSGNAFMILAVLLVGGLVLAGCQPTSPAGNGGNYPSSSQSNNIAPAQQSFNPEQEITTNTFKSEEEYLAFIKSRSGSDGYYGMGMALRASTAAAPMAAMAESADSAKSSNSGGADYSGTNNQVAGVDEADIIKTDGEYIYTVSGTTIFIIKAYPGEDAEVISEIKLKDYPQGLFLMGNKLAVFGQVTNYEYFRTLSWRPRNQMSFFNIYDISNKEKPDLEKEYKIEGYYQDARQTGEHAYFVTISSPEYGREYPTPVLYDGTTVKPMSVTDISYFPIPYNNVQLATITAINLDDLGEEPQQKSVAVEYGQTVYMSENNLYLAYTEYVNEWEMRNKIIVDKAMNLLSDADKELVRKIKAADSDILSDGEKDSKILQIAYEYVNYLSEKERQDFEDEVTDELKDQLKEFEYGEYTIINRISIDGASISIAANGKVPGHLNNQFSMDEHDNVLRVATTVNTRWSSYLYEDETEMATVGSMGVAGTTAADEMVVESKMIAPDVMPRFEQNTINNVYTLNMDLDMLDSLTGLAKGESIYSTRFIGGRLYMVTFRQIDPFFVIDLSDAKNIKELGQLKIPGFSRYLHPYDDNIVIGLGRDASESGQQRGLKISLFDVSNVAKPTEITKFTATSQYSSSVAEYEHKAFLFDKEKELLVIPAYSYNYDRMPMNGGVSSQGFNGAMVFKINPDEITLRGVIDHSLGSQYYGPTVQRSLFIDELLYTKSEGLLRINKLSDLSKVKNIELKGYDSPYPIY